MLQKLVKKNILDAAYSISYSWEGMAGFFSGRSAVRSPIEYQREGGCQWILTKDENLLTNNDDAFLKETSEHSTRISKDGADKIPVMVMGMMHRTYSMY